MGHSVHNPKKPNQDVYIIEPNLNGNLGFHLFGICDGHGLHGHNISNHIKTHLSKVIYKQILPIYLKSNQLLQIEQFYSKLPFFLQRSFQEMH